MSKKWSARPRLLGLLLAFLSFFMVAAFPFFRVTPLQEWWTKKSPKVTKERVAENLTGLLQTTDLPKSITIAQGEEKILGSLHYTIDPDAQGFIDREIRRYRPDYAAFIAIDATTGRILAMSSFINQQKGENLGNLALRTTFPAASVFKVITATAAIDQKKITADTRITFNGANHTLYKHNVIGNKITRWSREMSLREAFAKSVNTIFGKIGIVHVGPQGLREYANRYMFNQSIRADFPAPMGSAIITDDDEWSLAEAASGFTRQTTMSPIQAALIAAAVANDGVMMEPSLVSSVTGEKGDVLYHAEPSIASVTMNSIAAQDLRVLMQETVARGTSQKSFRKIWKHKELIPEIELGGKTGSLHGPDPAGRYDWFVGYLRFKEQKVAVAALTINKEKWRVKSAYLAGEFLAELVREQQKRVPSSARNPKLRRILSL